MENIIDKSKDLTVIAPCLNEKDNINEFYKETIQTIKKLNLSYQIIFIDDGSTDETWKIINDLSSIDTCILGIKLSRNYGHQNAILSSLNYIIGKYILFIDVDLQDPPELLYDMYKLMKSENANVVYAQRTTRNEGFLKKITANIFYFVFNIFSNIKIPKQVSDFKLIDLKVLENIKNFNEQEPYLRGIISWTGFKQIPLKFDRKKRKKGKSGWSLSKMFNFSLNAFFGFSIYPMRLSFIISLILALIFIFFGFKALYTYLIGENISGWTSIFLIIVLFNFFQFFILGLISEYTGRIYMEVKNRPKFIIDKILKN